MQQQALFAKMDSDSYFELPHQRIKSAHPPTRSETKIDRIQKELSGYSETVYYSCVAYKGSQHPMTTFCGLCRLLPAFLHGTAHFCVRCSRPSKGDGCLLRQE